MLSGIAIINTRDVDKIDDYYLKLQYITKLT